MQIELKDALARTNDSSKQAAGMRLGAAIDALGISRTKFAADSGQKVNAVLNTISGLSHPSKKSMKALWRMHHIDPAFIMFGDYAHLSTSMQDRIFAALEALANKSDRQLD